MNVISLLASPHGLKGNTAGLLGFVLDGAQAEGARTETIVLSGDTILPCRGCYACHRTGRCGRKDEFERLKKKLLAADGIVLASPNYIFR
jgi:multimeric flavodoxin WrbA